MPDGKDEKLEMIRKLGNLMFHSANTNNPYHDRKSNSEPKQHYVVTTYQFMLSGWLV